MDSNTESKLDPDSSAYHPNPPPYDAPPPGSQQQPYAPPPVQRQIVPAGTAVAPVIIVNQAVGSEPTTLTCCSCHARVVTTVQYETSMKTHIMAGLLCLLGCWPCCCIPYCMDSCRNAQHYCPNCNAYIGTYSS